MIRCARRLHRRREAQNRSLFHLRLADRAAGRRSRCLPIVLNTPMARLTRRLRLSFSAFALRHMLPFGGGDKHAQLLEDHDPAAARSGTRPVGIDTARVLRDLVEPAFEVDGQRPALRRGETVGDGPVGAGDRRSNRGLKWGQRIVAMELVSIDIAGAEASQRSIDRVEDVLARHALVPRHCPHLWWRG